MNFISAHLLRKFYSWSKLNASAQYDNTRGVWLTQEGCTIMERKEGRRGSEDNTRVIVSAACYAGRSLDRRVCDTFFFLFR